MADVERMKKSCFKQILFCFLWEFFDEFSQQIPTCCSLKYLFFVYLLCFVLVRFHSNFWGGWGRKTSLYLLLKLFYSSFHFLFMLNNFNDTQKREKEENLQIICWKKDEEEDFCVFVVLRICERFLADFYVSQERKTIFSWKTERIENFNNKNFPLIFHILDCFFSALFSVEK